MEISNRINFKFIVKPDAYMPMFWPAFWNAVEGKSDQFIVAYQRIIAHYWHHNHCQGLEDNDDFFRRLCRCDKDEWKIIGHQIFDNNHFMTQDEKGFWHQKRAFSEWQKADEKYQAAVAGGQNRWRKIGDSQRSKMMKQVRSTRTPRH